MTFLTKSLLALALTTFVAQAHMLDLTHSAADEASVEYLEASVVWNTESSYADSGHPVDAVFRRALPWQPETLRFRDVYTISFAPGTLAEPVPLWIAPLYDAYIVAANMFAPATYWIAGICLALLAISPKLQSLLTAMRGQARMACVFCESREIRRVPVGDGILGDIRRGLGQRAFRCNACNYKFFRRWEYEGAPTATRARVS